MGQPRVGRTEPDGSSGKAGAGVESKAHVSGQYQRICSISSGSVLALLPVHRLDSVSGWMRPSLVARPEHSCSAAPSTRWQLATWLLFGHLYSNRLGWMDDPGDVAKAHSTTTPGPCPRHTNWLVGLQINAFLSIVRLNDQNFLSRKKN